MNQTLPPDEILIVDDGSTDDILDIVEEYGVTMIRHRTNLGLASARNTAIRASHGRLISALDADCVPAPDWLERMKLYLDDRELDGCGGRVIDRFCSSPADHWRTTHLSQDRGDQEQVGQQFPGANTLFRRKVLFQIGLYNARYKTAGEDMDLCRRILANEGRIGYTPKAVVYHIRKDTPRSVARTHWRFHHSFDPDYMKGSTVRHWMNEIYTGLKWIAADVQKGNFRDIPLDLLVTAYLMAVDLEAYKTKTP